MTRASWAVLGWSCWAALIASAGGLACSSSTDGGAGGGSAGQANGAAGNNAAAGSTQGGTQGGSMQAGSANGGTQSGGGAGGHGGLAQSGGGASGESALGGAGNGGAGGGASQQCPWGDQMVHATSYGMATTLRICFVSKTAEELHYSITTPSAPASGGYVVISFRQVSPNFEVFVALTPQGDTIALDRQMYAAAAGADYDTWIAAAPSSSFDIEVDNRNGLGSVLIPNAFVMSATFVPVDDKFEPNDTEAQATPLTLGTPVTAYGFSGYGTSTNVFLNSWYDFYKVTLAAGTPTVTLTGLPKTTSFNLRLESNSAAENYPMWVDSTLTAGAATVTPPGPISAGVYTVVVEPSNTMRPYGAGAVPAAYATQPYTLTVTE